ncbi:HDOD domain-containing protein [Halomonas sp. LR5S13]|uniref:EAL and HDOD domain-containing protein n=1 Tax=Halomonas rhizosphaerae TaxID=3043296 RepID=UPI0024A95720|nr:HDOD domain-containing protein [Halomonas rhizosphaerae]MDI5922851.1 HDOD domain-containing protein [Halomonas rhizosphaerae]
MTGQGVTDRFTIAMHPIHDADYVHVADRLIYQNHDSDLDDPVSSMAKALSTVLYELDERQCRELFIELPSEWLVRIDLLPTPPSQVVIGLPRDLEVTPEVADSLNRIRERNYRIAMPDPAGQSMGADLQAFADIIEIDASCPLDSERLETLKAGGYQLLVEHIQDHEQLEQCLEAGCDYINGRYLSQPHYHASKPRGRHGNRAAQLRLINELYREDADLHRLHDLLLQMPHLHVAILRRANSSFFGQSQQQSDLRRAIQVIGLNELRRLVMTMSLASNMPSSRITVRLALIRAFMCQNLAEPFRNIDPEDAFTTGLFSLMAALLDEDQATLLEQVPLDDGIIRALEHHEGHLGAILAICEEHEQQLAENTSEHTAEQLQKCYLDALDKAATLMGRF